MTWSGKHSHCTRSTRWVVMSTRPSPCCAVSKNHAGRLSGTPDTSLEKWWTLSLVTAGCVRACPAQRPPNTPAMRRELPLQHGRDLVPLGHDVVEQDAPLLRDARTPCPARRSRPGRSPSACRRACEARLDRAREVLGLAQVVAGDDDHVAAAVGDEPLEEVRAGVRLPRASASAPWTARCSFRSCAGSRRDRVRPARRHGPSRRRWRTCSSAPAPRGNGPDPV